MPLVVGGIGHRHRHSFCHITMYYDVNAIIDAVKTSYNYSGISQKQPGA